ncbi:hypothetical protein PTKIN_Ptkin01aG0095000 [Pterospermum kingtungense]
MNNEEAENKTQNRNPVSNANPNINNPNPSQGPKGKSCKRCLYYSSTLKSKSQNPTYVGIPRTLPQVPSYIIGESELEASKEGCTLIDFKYACVGYSVYLDNKDSSTHQSDKHAELPLCVDLEVLLDRTDVPANNIHNYGYATEKQVMSAVGGLKVGVAAIEQGYSLTGKQNQLRDSTP